MRFRMSWRVIDFDWNRAKALLVAAEEGSFSGAARALGSTQSTVGRQIAALEQELGIPLVERIGRGIELTPSGLELVEHIRAMGESAARVSRIAAGQSLSLEGVVTISASEVISAFLLPGIVSSIIAEHPKLQIELIATNSTSDLRRREADIAIRNFEPQDPELVARKAGMMRARLYASADYLKTLPQPVTTEGLSDAVFLGFDLDETLINLLRSSGFKLSQPNFPVVCANQLVQWEMVKAGHGIGVMMEKVGRAEPGVLEVLPDAFEVPVPIWLTSHREVKTSKKIRFVFDTLWSGLSRLK